MSGAMTAQRLVWRGGLSFEGEDSWGHRVAISGDPAPKRGASPRTSSRCRWRRVSPTTSVEVLRKKRQDLRTMEVVVTSEQEDVSPWRFVHVVLRFEVGGEVDPAAARRALELAEKHCPVLATIAPTVRVEASIEVTPAS